MASNSYYGSDLAWVHHVGYSHHAELTGPGVVGLLREHGLAAGASVLDVGCGSGLLARQLRARGVDASPAMIGLARDYEPSARFEVVSLRTGLRAGDKAAFPESDAVVSTGHVLNYLHTRAQIAQALSELARAVRPGGLLAIDLMTEAFCDKRDLGQIHAKVREDWVIVTRFSRPEPYRFDRAMTVLRREGATWRRSDEYHRNVTFDIDEALRVLRDNGLDAYLRASFGAEELPAGLVVLAAART